MKTLVEQNLDSDRQIFETALENRMLLAKVQISIFMAATNGLLYGARRNLRDQPNGILHQ